ncbi:acetyltransferase [Myxococcota bacterium]|nr:acetyltransferase [Myxococcota bacterium]MBU1534255.1 acetyltransferase [Myxococcota bacterium]
MKLVLLGGGGHCRSVLDVLCEDAKIEIVGILDLEDKVGQFIDDVPVIGTEALLPELKHQGVTHAFITVGSIENTAIREGLAATIEKEGYVCPIVIASSAVVSQKARLGPGSFVGKNATINAGTRIGSHCIINTGAIVEHDCELGDFVHIGPGATLCGQVTVGTRTLIGSNSSVIQNIHVGEDAVIGAGSVVIRDLGKGKKVVGNPSRELP